MTWMDQASRYVRLFRVRVPALHAPLSCPPNSPRRRESRDVEHRGALFQARPPDRNPGLAKGAGARSDAPRRSSPRRLRPAGVVGASAELLACGGVVRRGARGARGGWKPDRWLGVRRCGAAGRRGSRGGTAVGQPGARRWGALGPRPGKCAGRGHRGGVPWSRRHSAGPGNTRLVPEALGAGGPVEAGRRRRQVAGQPGWAGAGGGRDGGTAGRPGQRRARTAGRTGQRGPGRQDGGPVTRARRQARPRPRPLGPPGSRPRPGGPPDSHFRPRGPAVRSRSWDPRGGAGPACRQDGTAPAPVRARTAAPPPVRSPIEPSPPPDPHRTHTAPAPHPRRTCPAPAPARRRSPPARSPSPAGHLLFRVRQADLRGGRHWVPDTVVTP